MWKLVLLILTVVPVEAQSLEAQRASIARQRAAILRQRGEVRWTVTKPSCSVIDASALGRMIEVAAATNRVPPEVVREVARQESAFQPCAVSKKGAQGLMQLMPATQASLGVEDPFDPEASLMAGARLLRELLSRYSGSLPLALSAYNAGSKEVDRADGIPPIAETRNYVARILDHLSVP